MSQKRPLVVEGFFEEATIFEALHIIGWLKKTGCLRVEAPRARGVVLIRDGLVVSAYTQSTMGRMIEIGQGLFHGDREDAIKQQILTALHEFEELEDGAFYFSQQREPQVQELPSVTLSDISLHHGLTTDQLVLILAHQRDEKHHASPAAEPLPSEQLTKAPSSHPVFRRVDRDTFAPSYRPTAGVLLVDDEAPVRQIVGDELRKVGYEVRTAWGPGEALAVALEFLRPESKDMIIVTDLGMPTSSQKSYLGGLELVRNLVERGVDVPVLLTAENLSDSSRDEAKRLGVRKVVFKPSLSKLDQEQYETDLRSFAALLIDLLKETEVQARETQDRAAADKEANAPLARHFLTSMREQLTDPERSLRISNHVLPVVACLASTDKNENTLFQGGTHSELMDYSNLRKHERVLSRIDTTFSCRKEVGKGYLSDLSEKGAFLNTTKLFPVGEIVRLRMSLPYRLGEVTAEARIVWLNYKAHELDTAPHGMGLRFIGPFS